MFVRENTLLRMWDAFTALPKNDIPEKGTDGTYIYAKLAEIFIDDEMMSELETIAWTPKNPNPLTLRKYLCFQGA